MLKNYYEVRAKIRDGFKKERISHPIFDLVQQEFYSGQHGAVGISTDPQYDIFIELKRSEDAQELSNILNDWYKIEQAAIFISHYSYKP